MKRSFKKILVIVFSGIFFVCGCEEFFRRCIGGFAGSYASAETWVIDAKESDVIKAIREIKIDDSLKHNEKFEVVNIAKRDTDYDWLSPEMLTFRKRQEKDSTILLPKFDANNSKPSYWLFIDFYYKDTRQRIRSWTRPFEDSLTTDFAFVSITDRDDSEHYKLINSDFWYFENKREIKKFKTLIVDKITSHLKRK